MRYPDAKNYDSPDDYYDAIEQYEKIQRIKRYGYDDYEPEDEEPDYDYDKEADRYFSERSNSFEYGKYK